MNRPPPFLAASEGKLHILPRPTALPAAASTKPIDPENAAIKIVVSKAPGSDKV